MSDLAQALPAPAVASAGPPRELVRAYVWELPVRITHWLIVLSIVVLAATGIYIGHPFITVAGPARAHFVTGWVKTIHFYTAYVFITAVFARVIWMFTGSRYARWDAFIPVSRARRRDMWQTLKFYLFARRDPPPSVGHNPLAGLTYTLVFGLYFLMIATGLMLRGASADPGSFLRWWATWAALVGGFQNARWIHHVGMWLLLAFAVHHVYSAVLMSIIERNGTVDSIFSGYKFVPPEQVRAPRQPISPAKGQVDE